MQPGVGWELRRLPGGGDAWARLVGFGVGQTLKGKKARNVIG